MLLPIVAYGHPNLRKISVEIDKDYPELDKLIADMFETMYVSNGVGLAAPQVNRQIRLFVLDTKPFSEDNAEVENFKRAFINPTIIKEEGEEWAFSEGCLSIPDIHENVIRKPKVRITYYDESFNFHDEIHDGMVARVIQHEFDHLNGVLFVDKINPLRRMLLKRKLQDISKGEIEVSYKMIFPLIKRRSLS
jgi:peptide deformylase